MAVANAMEARDPSLGAGKVAPGKSLSPGAAL
jgi:hypothetical protein